MSTSKVSKKKDVSSVGTAPEEELDVEDVNLDLNQHYQNHLGNVARLSQRWQITQLESDHRELILKPQANKLRSVVLHPALYRNVVALNDPDAFASRLGIKNCRDSYNVLKSNEAVSVRM